MTDPESVKVYCFRGFDLDINEVRVWKCKATHDAILAQLGGEVHEGTEHDVSAAEVDGQVRYRRVAAGWGELN